MIENLQHLVVSIVELVLIICSTKAVMVVAAIVGLALHQSIIRDARSTSVVLDRKIMKPAKNATNFLAQLLSDSATVLFGFITCQL